METTNKTTFVKLTDLEAELRDMDSVIANDRKNEIRTSDQLLMEYEAKKAEIDAKKEEIRKQINSLIESGLLNEKDAQPSVNGIDSGLDLKGPVCGYDCSSSYPFFPSLTIIDFYNPRLKSE